MLFIDIGFDQDEAVVFQMRASLMSDLRLYIEKQVGNAQSEGEM